MAEQVVAQAQPEAQAKVEPQASLETVSKSAVGEPAVEPKPTEDLVSRVSKFKAEPQKEKEPNPFNLSKEDYDKVQSDPTLSKFYKSMQADYVKKTQELAEGRKQVEAIQKQTSNWTPERLQAELNKPDFIQAAQKVASINNPPNSGLTDQEYSALTDKEKAQLSDANKRIANLESQNWQMLQRQQDEQLKNRYANYAPDIVDTTINKLVRGEVKADREVVWKALDYDEAVKRAYELGKQDKASENKEKITSMSPDGFSVTTTADVPPINQGESNTAYFKRLAARRLAMQGQQTR